MSKPAYIVHIDGSDKEQRFREHPVLDFLFDHQEAFDHGDMKSGPYTRFHTDDFVFTKSDGTVFPPGEASWQGWLSGYAPFTEHLHEPRYCNVYERDDGSWEMMGIAHIYGNFPVPGGDKTKTDFSGRQWGVVVPGAMVFRCVKDPSGPKGFKVKSMTVYGDGTPVVAEMIKRGMIKPEDLAK
ncbi:uncharacterized protein Z519_07654 [Cladophialophora bantiana CBS 173.52]|uniref:SnoaL-like domain-containing protein n=1 Tax=Cladophialophora bantiana (strain ATCC 10958 / CBS 173.52 / CDC B-1940 / NIH 8579) TaxID=1442370 RepID=A0A0D2ENX7_CLAB1|nr:uncharacterized protein Z519_07654 [Cladophialophora bantiana CBS 173.52]KIW91686.1 hypothetical protein Z519_07654 [Cladophialophora bantiana CBS 173.52]